MGLIKWVTSPKEVVASTTGAGDSAVCVEEANRWVSGWDLEKKNPVLLNEKGFYWLGWVFLNELLSPQSYLGGGSREWQAVTETGWRLAESRVGKSKKKQENVDTGNWYFLETK